jgi:hypothetical protein
MNLSLDAMQPHLRMVSSLDPGDVPADVRSWLMRCAVVPMGGEDLHQKFVACYDGPQHNDPERTQRYLTALDRVRDLADTENALTVRTLCEVQALVLGELSPASLRSTDAFARGGAHRYPFRDDLHDLLDASLRRWCAPEVDPVVAACGLYFDMIFMHPFCDGNARAARLWHEWALRRGGRPTVRYEDILLLRKTPGDIEGFWRMVRISAALITDRVRKRCDRERPENA